MYGHNIVRTNFNPAEATTNAGNVDQLAQRWPVDIGSDGTPSSSGPVVSDGVLYVGSSAASGDNYVAFNAISGSPVWARSRGYRDDCLNVGIGSTAAVCGTLLVVGADNDAANRPYFRQGNDATRGQIAKIAVGALTGGTACAGEAAR